MRTVRIYFVFTLLLPIFALATIITIVRVTLDLTIGAAWEFSKDWSENILSKVGYFMESVNKK